MTDRHTDIIILVYYSSSILDSYVMHLPMQWILATVHLSAYNSSCAYIVQFRVE